jgi:serine/threonine protein kinase
MKISNYNIINTVGEGGMATVFLAHDNKFDTEVAIKLLRKEFVLNENIRKRFIAEARNMFKMSHPNIIKVTDLIEEVDTVAFVMEYVEGETLKEYIDRKGKLSDQEIKSLFSQMLDALGYVHEQNLVHRDIKPSNFMVNQEGKVKLMDFGIAKNTDSSSAEYTQTGTGVQMGTPMYMSPEQVKSTKDVTIASDIYSLGVVLWQMVTSKKPYQGDTMSTFEIQLKIVQNPLDLTNSAWDALIQKATQKEEKNRYESCFALLKAIKPVKRSNNSTIVSDLTIIDKPNNSDQTIIETTSHSDILLKASLFDKKSDSLKYGFVDIKGNWIIQPKFDGLSDFDELGLSDFDEDGLSYFDEEGYCRASFNEKKGFINRKGDWVIFPNFGNVFYFDKKGYCEAEIYGENKEFEPKLAQVNLLGNWESVKEESEKKNKRGLINRQGNWEIEPRFRYLGEFDEKDYCPATLNGENWGFINRQMEWIIEPKFERVTDFDDSDYCCVESKSFWGFSKSKWGLIDRNGDWIIKPKFDWLVSSRLKDYYAATLNGKTGIINYVGNWIVQPIFDDLGSFDKGFCKAKLDEKWGYIDFQGNWVVQPIFDKILFWDLKDYGLVSLNEKYGFINRQGNWIIKPKFERIRGKSFGLGKRGNYILSPMPRRFMVFIGGYCVILIKEKFGLINRNGDLVLKPNYYYLENVSDEFNVIFKAALNKKKYGFINEKGDWLIKPIFDADFD